MNLSPLYELRERLAGSMIAGVNLIKEDFRFIRAIEAFEPLTRAAPVFQKIYNTAKEAIHPDCKEPAGILLDALALVDAVIYTQGITETQKEPEKILFGEAKEYQNISYSELFPLLEALTSTGSQRLEIVQEAYQSHPAYFSDYRVRYALTKALLDNYTEMAEKAEEILYKEDETIIPILKKELVLDGTKGMQRYIHVIEKIAKEKENDFYLYLTENAEKGVKQAAIEALRYKKENAEYLLHLIKTEKGANKKAAQYALAFMETPETISYWEKELKKSPDTIKEFLQFTATKEISNKIAEQLMVLLKQILEKKEITAEEFSDVTAYGEMLLGKDTTAVCEVYRFLAKEEKIFSKITDPKDINKNGQAMSYYGCCYPALSASQKPPYSITQIFKEKLLDSLLYSESPVLKKLIEELYETYKDSYSSHAFLAALLQKKKEKVYEEFSPLIEKADKKTAKSFFNILGMIQYDEKKDRHNLYQQVWMHRTSRRVGFQRALAEKLDERWYLLLTAFHFNKSETFYYTHNMENNRDYRYIGYNQRYDDMLVDIADVSSSNSRKIIGNYICQLALNERRSNQVSVYYSYLRYLKWENYQGMLLTYLKNNKDIVSFWDIKNKFQILGFTNEQSQKELEQIIEAINKKEISLQAGTIDQILKYYEELKNI